MWELGVGRDLELWDLGVDKIHSYVPSSRKASRRLSLLPQERLDAHVREIVRWHFDPATGCPFWLERASDARLRPADRGPDATAISTSSAPSRTSGCAADRCGAGCPRPTPTSRSTCSRPAAAPACPSRASRTRTSASTTRTSARRCPDDAFPKGSDWLMVGPSGPRRLRLAVEHLAQHRGGICFMVDLDPRWVIKLIKNRQMDQMEAYKRHVIDQALTLLRAHDNIKCLFTTPKLLEALCEKVSLKKMGITRRLLRRHRDDAAVPPLRGRGAARRHLLRADLRQHADGPGDAQAAASREDNYAIIYYPPHPRAMIEVVDPDRARSRSSATARPAASG